jgi:hypothetical protein
MYALLLLLSSSLVRVETEPTLFLSPLLASSASDFQKTFLPFEEKKDTTLAPINRFAFDKRKDINGKGKGRSASPMDLDEEMCELLSSKGESCRNLASLARHLG